MADLKFADTHNMVAFLSKPAKSEEFEQIVDFLNANPIRYALTINPTIYISCIEQFWSTIKAKTVNREVQLHTLVDGKKIIITESIVRRDLRLEDADGVNCLPNATIFERLTLMGGPTKHVADKAVHKERGDSLVRAATTASNLEAEQDGGNISKTRSKATPNEVGSQGTASGGNTLQSGEDRLKLEELMDLCTNLQIRVLDLENIKTSQRMEIDSLKRRVKRLEKKGRSRTHKLKRLYKVSLTARVDSSKEEEVLGEDASKQERINDIDEDEDITLVSVQDDADAEMFDVGTLTGKEVVVVEEINKRRDVVDEVAEVIKTAQVSVASAKVSTVSVTITTTTTEDDLTLAQALVNLKSTKPKAKGITFRESGELTTTIFSQQFQDKGLSQDKGKGILVEPEKSLKKKYQLKLDEEIALKLQAKIDEKERIARTKEEKIDEANIAWDDIQAKVDADYQLAKRLQAEEQEQFIIEEKATLFKELLEQRIKHFAAKRAEEKRNKTPTQDQQRKIMCTYRKNMEGKKPKDLMNKSFDSIQKMFDRVFKRVNTFVDFRIDLVEAKVDNDQEIAKIKELMKIVSDEEEVAIDAIPLATKSLSIVGWKIHKEGKKSYYQIIRADGKSQMYLVFSHMLKRFDREDLETLWKLLKAKYGSTRPIEDLD
ncbi:hypothetical protein Tco_1397927, partial [Tanacetum coccineum]